MWKLFLFFVTILLQPSLCLKYEFMAIKSSNQIPSNIPSNIGFVNDRLRINSLEKHATFLTIIKPALIPFSIFFKNNETSKSCISEFEMQFGGYSIAKVIVSCEQYWSKLCIDKCSESRSKPNEKECYANVTINSTSATISYSGESQELKLDKYNIEENIGNNSSVISFAISVTVTNDNADSTCSPYVEFGSEHYLAAIHPAQEIITTTTTTTKKPTTVPHMTKATPHTVHETSNNGPILWILIFVFSGTFAAAFGGVGMFFFLRYREKRLEKKQARKSGDDEMHTAKEHQTPPKSVKSTPPRKSLKSVPPKSVKSIPSKTATPTTAKSQPSKV